VKNSPLLGPRKLQGNRIGIPRMMTKKMVLTDQHGLQIITSAWYYSVINLVCPMKVKATASRKIHTGPCTVTHLDIWSLPQMSSTLHIDHQLCYVYSLFSDSETNVTWHYHASFVVLRSIYGSNAMNTEGVLQTIFIHNFFTTFHKTLALLTRRQ
jgi:hypothetical protein